MLLETVYDDWNQKNISTFTMGLYEFTFIRRGIS
jgi:hypothetical protein